MTDNPGGMPRAAGRRRPTFKARSIRGRLLFLLLILALAPLALIGFLSGYHGKRLLQQSIGSNFQKVARAVVSSMDQGIDQRRQTVVDMAYFPEVIRLAEKGHPELQGRENPFPDMDGAERRAAWEDHAAGRHPLTRTFENLVAVTPDLMDLTLTNQDGWVVAGSAAPEVWNLSTETWWFRAASGRCTASYVDDMQYDEALGDQVTAVTVPVCEAGRVVGVLRAKLSLSTIFHMVSDLDLEGVARVWIINNNGSAVAALEDMRLTRMTSERAAPAAAVARSIVGSVSGHLESTMAGVPSVVGYAASTGAGQFRGLGWIVLVVEPASSAYAAITRFQVLLGIISAIMVVLVVLIGLRAAGTLTSPIRRSTEVAEAVARGDLRPTLAYSGQEELDRLADGLNGMTANLRRMVGSIRTASLAVDATSQGLMESSGSVLSGSRDQVARVEETARLMDEADASLEHVSVSLSGMVSATDKCSDSISEMDTNISEIVNSTESLAGSTDSTLASVEQMVTSIQQVDRSVDSMRQMAVAATASVAEMENAIERVDAVASRTAEATARAAHLAEVGEQAVERTVGGMGKIEEAAGCTAQAIRRLTDNVERIGGIVAMIREVTEQTNLLALNASILAAQAGEHGGGFAVVAAEIKDLAERTALSTKEIAALIGAIQEGAREAGDAMADGLLHVNDGVERSREAGQALREILEGTQRSASLTQEIADSASHHAEQSRNTAQLFKSLNETVTRISAVTQEQSKGCDAILGASQQMREQTVLVRRAILEQKQGSLRISDSVSRVTDVAKEIEEAGEQQRRLSRSVVESMQGIGSLSQDHIAALVAIHDRIRALTDGARDLGQQIELFTDDGPDRPQ